MTFLSVFLSMQRYKDLEVLGSQVFFPHVLQSLAEEIDYFEDPDDLLDIGNLSGFFLVSESFIRLCYYGSDGSWRNDYERERHGADSGFLSHLLSLLVLWTRLAVVIVISKGLLMENVKIWVRVKRCCGLCVGVSAKEILFVLVAFLERTCVELDKTQLSRVTKCLSV